MVDRDDLAFFAKAMTPSKAATEAGWARLRASIDAAETAARDEPALEPVSVARASKLAIYGGASLLAAAAIGVLALGIGRERWSIVAEESEASQAVDAHEGGNAAPLETRPAVPRSEPVSTPNEAIAPTPGVDVPARDAESGSNPTRVEARRPARASRPPRIDASPSRVDAKNPPSIDDSAPPADAAVTTTPVAPPVQAPDALALEAASLRHVERALAAGQLARARTLLRTHRQRFPRGLLAREASLLQVVIACEGGDADTAGSAARDHSVAFPDDPTTARLRKQICSK